MAYWKTCLCLGSFAALSFFWIYKLNYYNFFVYVFRETKQFLLRWNKSTDNDIKKNVKIYFGSQGGTAEGFAKELKKDLKELFSINAEIIDLEFFNKQEIEKKGIRVFMVATYGNGDPTDNAIDFFQWLKTLKNDNTYFRNTKYSIMGLGSKEYAHFNKMAKKLDAYLSKFQAEKISETILGDDDDNIYQDFEVWKNKFFQQLPKILQIKNVPLKPINKKEIELINWKDLQEITLDIKFVDDDKTDKKKAAENDNSKERNLKILNEISTNHTKNTFSFNTEVNSKFYFNHEIGQVLSNHNILKNVKQSIYGDKVNHLTIDIKNLSYKTAENFYILPKNSKEVVSWWLQRLHIDDEKRKFIFINRTMHSDNYSDALDAATSLYNNGQLKMDTYYKESHEHTIHSMSNSSETTNNPFNLDFDASTIFAPFPTPCSIKEALEYYCDLTTIPRMNILKKFNCFLKDLEELKMFNFIMSNNQRNTFIKICNECSLTLPEFVNIYMTSAEFELSPFLQLIQKNTPKAYTISSSPKVSSNILSITVKKKQYPIHSLKKAFKQLKENNMLPKIKEEKLRELCKKGRLFKGTASYYLTEELQINDIVKFHIKPSKFILPKNLHSANIIMIATGTGIAPFRGFIAEFQYYDQYVVNTEKKKRSGKRILFFGCKWKQVDLLYEEDFIKAKKEAYIDEVHFAFSRDQERKIYVQDLILQQKELIWSLLMKGAYIYVCGNTNMSKDVATVVNNLAKLNNHSDKKFVKKLKKSGRYIEETW